MKHLSLMAVLLTTCSGWSQQVRPSERLIEHLEVHGGPRLGALANLGALTGTSMLLEIGNMSFMQEPVDVKANRSKVEDVVRQILGSSEKYTLRNYGMLLIISTAKVSDRMLNQPLGHFHFQGSEFSSLDPLLAEAIREANGCKVMGTAWAGPELRVEVPKIDLANATFEHIVARVADAPEATMWIVQTKARPAGCFNDPGSSWETGVYGFGAGFSTCQMPFLGSAGPQFLAFSSKTDAYPQGCKPNLTRPQAVPF